MLSRRDALAVVAALLARSQPQAQTATCRPVPETLVVNFGAGACTVKQIRIVQGALSVTIPVADVMSALGAKVGGDD